MPCPTEMEMICTWCSVVTACCWHLAQLPSSFLLWGQTSSEKPALNCATLRSPEEQSGRQGLEKTVNKHLFFFLDLPFVISYREVSFFSISFISETLSSSFEEGVTGGCDPAPHPVWLRAVSIYVVCRLLIFLCGQIVHVVLFVCIAKQTWLL